MYILNFNSIALIMKIFKSYVINLRRQQIHIPITTYVVRFIPMINYEFLLFVVPLLLYK